MEQKREQLMEGDVMRMGKEKEDTEWDKIGVDERNKGREGENGKRKNRKSKKNKGLEEREKGGIDKLRSRWEGKKEELECDKMGS